MKNELDILHDVRERLETLNIKYMLTGSLAMSFYGTPRMTRDIDIVIELNSLNVESFINSFKDDYYLSPETIKDSIATEFIFNLIDFESSIKIDFIIKKNEDYRKTEFDRRNEVGFTNEKFTIVSKEDLIISKLIWFKESESEMQKKDISNLLRTDFDEKYLMHWIKTLDLFEHYLKVKNE